MTGYLFLGLTILSTAWILVGLRELKRWDIHLFQAITWNYLIAALLGFIRSPEAFTNVIAETGALYSSLYLGLAFINLFFLMGTVAQKLGVGYMTVVTKMSLVIPITFAWLYYQESMTLLKGMGILLALASVFLINYRPGDQIQLSNKGPKWLSLLLIVLLFIGCGINDLVFKIFNVEYSRAVPSTDFPVVIFAIAGGIGALICAFQLVRGSSKFDPKAIIAGVLIGVPNYFSIFWFVECLDHFPATVFFPINNTGLLVVTTLVGLFVYKERFNLYNFAGLALAILAVILLF